MERGAREMKETEKIERPNPKFCSPVSFPPKGGRGVAGSLPDPEPVGGKGGAVSPGISEPDPLGGIGGSSDPPIS